MSVDMSKLKFDDVFLHISKLRSEQDIMASWKNPVSRPLVSISCITYNHASYIEEALKGFLTQETDFSFEILIHDDASTDQTANIVREYEKKYPRIIKAIYQTENKYSQGVKIGSTFNYPRAQGDYIALCEGDDYWISKEKLQLQIDQMRANPQYGMSFHPALRVDQQTGNQFNIGCYAKGRAVVSVEDIIEKKYGQIPTASTIFSSKLMPTVLKYFEENKVTVGDIYLHFFTADFGNGALFTPEAMSVYRVNIEGSWNDQMDKSPHLKVEHIINRIKAYSKLDSDTDGRYKKSFIHSSFKMYKSFLISDCDLEDKVKTYSSVANHFSYSQRLVLMSILKLNFLIPNLKKVKNKLRGIRSSFKV